MLVVIAAVRAEDVQQSIWSNYERMFGLWVLAHIFVFYFIVTTTITAEREWVWIFRAWSLAAVIVALVPFFQSQNIFGTARVESTFNNATFLATYLLLSFFVTLWLALSEEKFSFRGVLAGIAAFIIFITMTLTGTRGAMIAWLLGLFLAMLFFIGFSPRAVSTLSLTNKGLRKIFGASMAFFILIVIVGYSTRDSLKVSGIGPLERIASISLNGRSLQGRLLAWQVTWQGWKERPTFGWGPENYNLLFNSHYDPRLVEQEPWFDRAHNFIFDVGSTVGILGLVVYLGIYGTALSGLFMSRKNFWLFDIFSVLLITHLVQNLLVFDSTTAFIFLFIVFAFINSRFYNERFSRADQERNSSIFVIIGLMVTLPLFYVGVWKPFWENRIGKLGYDAFAKAESDDTAIRYTEQALSHDTYGNIDVRRGVAEYVFEYLKQGGRVRDEKSLRRVIEYAIEKMEDNIRERPRDVKWYMYQGQLYNLHATILGKPDPEYAAKAEKRFLEAAVMSPQRMQIYLEIAQARKVQGNISGVWNAIDKAETLVPEYGVPHVNALVHAIDLGDRSREAQELSWLGEHLVEDRESIRDAYYRVRRFDDAAVTEISIIRNREHDTYDRKELAKEYKNLAIFYKEAGKFTQAREAALRVVELDQSQKASAEAFIQSLKALER